MSRDTSSRRAFLRNSSGLVVPGLLLAGTDRARAASALPKPGAVYALANTAAANQVAVFLRAANGTITPSALVPTDGLGTGDGPDTEGLQSQGAMILGPGNLHLYAVNGGSDSISVFSVVSGGLKLIQVLSSAGHRPISLTIHQKILYVLNYDRLATPAQGGNIVGFRVGNDGRLSPIAFSGRPLSGIGTNPGQVAFSPDGRLLAVTEKATNQILTYTVDSKGFATGPRAFPSFSDFPFCLAFGPKGLLVVADDFNDVPGQGAASSFRVSNDGSVVPLSGTVANHQDGTCWVVVTADGRFAITASTNNSFLTTYQISSTGQLTLLDPGGATVFTGGLKPRDLAFGGEGRYLYALNSASGSVACFDVLKDGHLNAFELIGGVPFPGSNGLAAY